MHNLHSAGVNSFSRERGYTLLEVVVAMVVLLVSITAITVAVADTQLSAAEARLTQMVVNQVDTNATLLTTAPFPSLVSGEFTPPDACTFPGVTDALSCVEVGGSTYLVTWTVLRASSDPDSVVVVGEAEVGSDTVTVSKVVNRP